MAALILATGNAHKADEILSILGSAFQYRTLKDFPDAPKTKEDADTFAGNAAKKAIELADWLVNPFRTAQYSSLTGPAYVLADDSGLEVDALDGAPGVHSARFAALDSGVPGNSSDAENNAKLLRLLRDVPLQKRTARFRCVIALLEIGAGADADKAKDASSRSSLPKPRLFEGFCPGRILFERSGQGGFGYDPLFVPDGFDQTFAELGEATKNDISHRARALAEVRRYFQQQDDSGG